MNKNLIIDSNIKVSISRLLQYPCYSGMVEGYPTAELNSNILIKVKEKAKIFCGMYEVYLIEPEKKPFPFGGNLPHGNQLCETCSFAVPLYGFRPYRINTNRKRCRVPESGPGQARPA